MVPRIFLGVVLTLLCTGWAAAQSGERAENAHQVSHRKMQQCRKEAVEQGLEGDALRAHVARCMKK